MEARSRAERISAVSALDDPVRRALYELVSGSEEPIGRDHAASSLGLTRSTAAFHLDRLVDEGILEVTFKRLTGRTGPGSGRPAKHYFRSRSEIDVSIPERHYELAGDLLANAIEESERTGRPVRSVVRAVARTTGRQLGAGGTTFEAALEDNGFEPRHDDADDVVLGTCPFHRLATAHTELVCELNFGLMQGIADGAARQASGGCYQVTRDPRAGRCCVRASAPKTSR